MLRRRLIEDPGMLMEFETIAQIKEYLRRSPEENEELVQLALKAIDWQLVFEAADISDLKSRADKIYEDIGD